MKQNKDLNPGNLTVVQTLNQYATPLEKLLSKSLVESSDTSLIFFFNFLRLFFDPIFLAILC